MKRNFQLALQLIVFVFALNIVTLFAIVRPVEALTPANGWLATTTTTELRANDMTFDFDLETTGDVLITVPVEFTGTGSTTAVGCAVTGSDWAANHSITCTALSAGAISVDINGLTNPVAGAYLAYMFSIEALDELTEPTLLEEDLQIYPAGSDLMSSIMIGDNSDHSISYLFETTPEEDDTFTITFPTNGGFDCTGLTSGDVDAGLEWDVTTVNDGTCEILLTANTTPMSSPNINVTILSTNMVNPVAAGNYSLILDGSEISSNTVNLPIGSGTGIDVLSNYVPGANSSHELTYSFGNTVAGWTTFNVTFPTTDGFVCTGLVEGDITLSEGWTVTNVNDTTCAIELEADNYIAVNPIVITIADTHMTNPIAPGIYNILADGSNETSTYDIPVTITSAASGSDVMSRQTVGTNSSHTISYLFEVAPEEFDTFTISFPTTSAFVCTGLVNGDVTTSSTDWSVDTTDDTLCEIVLVAGATPSGILVVTIASTHMVNPASVNSYNVYLSGSGESMTLQVAVVDSDTVNVNGFIASSLAFDLDTTTVDSTTYPDCDADTCLAYEEQTNTGPTNYTVDLGNLTIALVNKSSDASVLHADGGEGLINSIYFDLSTNAASGAVVTYKSAYGELRGPAHSTTIADDLDIPTVPNGSTPIVAGTAAYGIQLATLPLATRFGTGTQTVNCGASGGSYCVMGVIEEGTGNNTQTAQPIYTTTGPIEGGRGKIDVAAAVDGTNVPGTYTDQITFIATSTF